jgi:hypothetical protein
MANELVSVVARKITQQIDILIHKPKIFRMSSQQPSRPKQAVDDQSILDMGTVSEKTSSMAPHYACMPSRT